MSERISLELKEAFKGWLKTKGIKVALFDLDDTLIHTNEIFGRQKEAFWKFCESVASHIDPTIIRTDYEKLDTESYQLMGVSRRKWQHIVDKLSEIHGVEIWREGVDILERVYDLSPSLFDGALETLSVFKNSGIRLGLITHATHHWTQIKLASTGLEKYFEHIKIVDIEEHCFKTSEHWQQAINFFKVPASQVIAVGDNLKGDILAASQAGIQTLAWIQSKWSVYGFGELPKGAHNVNEIGNLIPELLKVR